MKNLGKPLSKSQQKLIKGGRIPDLSLVCGYIVFNSTESQCTGLGSDHEPIWNAANQTCSALGELRHCASHDDLT